MEPPDHRIEIRHLTKALTEVVNDRANNWRIITYAKILYYMTW
jgi:hypothetical protein